MTRLVRYELGLVARSWVVVVIAGVVAFPAVLGVRAAPSYAIRDNFDLFGLMFDGWVPLLFPILVTALYLPRMMGDIAFGYIRTARTRASMATLVGSRLGAAGILAFGTFLLSTLVAGVVAFGLNGSGDLVGITSSLGGETIHAVATRTAFSRLYPVSPWLFLVVFSLWVAVNAGLWAIVGGLALLIIGNRFLALAVPVLLYHGGDVALAYLGLEQFRVSSSVFQTNVTQQPVWYPFCQLLVMAGLVVGLAWRLRRTDFESAALS